jgi:hypothetical protein
MSHTGVGVYKRLRRENPKLEFVVRLYDDRISHGTRPGPSKFVARMVPIINQLRPYAKKFEIHNEPNHADGLEGWGSSDAEARAFAKWYVKVLAALKKACPWARFGFPGLALNHPHRDLAWLDICRDAVQASHWLGCHCYWQHGNMMSKDWGLRFRRYHDRFPNKRIEITEFGNSTPGLSQDQMASQFVRYYTGLNKYWYLGSASAFIASSPDPAWGPFVWMREGGELLPVVSAVGDMERKAVEVLRKRKFAETGKTVAGSFLEFFEKYGKAICGFPITDQIKENGIQSQYFERVGLEQPKTGQIRLKPVGTEAWTSRTRIAELVTDVHELSQRPLITIDEILQTLSEIVGFLEEQIRELQETLGEVALAAGSSEGTSAALAASLAEQILELQEARDGLHAEMEAALKAKREEQTALISYLRARVGTLLQEIKELESRQAPTRIGKPDVANVVDELPKHPSELYAKRSRSDIVILVIHHSAAPASVLPETIAKYHIEHWDWPGIGYHYLVGADGMIYQGNELETISNHATSANPHSVAICFLGNFMKKVPTQKQLSSGAHLVAWLMQELNLGPEAIKGHQEVMDTACPGKQWLKDQEWKGLLLKEVTALRPGTPASAPAARAKPIYHYMLFWARNGTWDETNWHNAEEYVSSFQPAVGFRTGDARQAEYVTIVGGQEGITKAVEDWLKTQGCKVDRIAGSDQGDTKRLLDEMVQENRRFLAFEE